MIEREMIASNQEIYLKQSLPFPPFYSYSTPEAISASCFTIIKSGRNPAELRAIQRLPSRLGNL
jgi:hypothetical protein